MALAICAGMLSGGVKLNADPVATDALLSGQVVDDYGVPVTNMNIFAVGVWGETNTFSAQMDTNGNFQMGVIGGVGGYFLRLDQDPEMGALSRGLVSFWISETVPSGGSISNLTLVARRITGSFAVTIVNGGDTGFHSGLIAKSTIQLTGSVTTDNFDTNAPLYTPSNYNTNGVVTNGLYDTNLLAPVLLLPTNLSPATISLTNFVGPTNFHFVGPTDGSGVIYNFFPPSVPITNIEVYATLVDGKSMYLATPQRTGTNGTAVLYVCQPLDAMNLDCQIYRGTLETVASNKVAITLTYYTNAPLQILTNIAAGTNGVPYNGWVQTSGGYWPFRWSIVGGTLPPGLATNQYSPNQLTGLPTQEGSYTFMVQVTDNMQQTTTTNLTINIVPPPPPRFSAPLCLNGSQFQLHLAGMSNRNYAIQFTSDLTSWTTLAVTNVVGPDTIFVDTNSGDGMRIYRAVQVP
jgi:hypothetical protein